MDDTKVIIHVRFAPNGQVTEIGERPASLAPQAWFATLSDRAGTSYQPLSGGRGVFRLTRGEIAGIQPPAA
jgi:hypothetical protein